MEDERLDIAATAENLKEIRQFVRNYIDKCKGLEEYKDELVLAIDEACQNVVRHAYKDKAGDLAIKLSFKDSSFILGFE